MAVAIGPKTLALTPNPRGAPGGKPEGGKGPGREPGENPPQARKPGDSNPAQRGEREKERESQGPRGASAPKGGRGRRRPQPGRRRQQNRNSKNPCPLANSLTHPWHRTNFHTPHGREGANGAMLRVKWVRRIPCCGGGKLMNK